MRDRNSPGSASIQKRDLDGLAEELRKEFDLAPEICHALAEKFSLHLERLMAHARGSGQILYDVAAEGVHSGVSRKKMKRVAAKLTMWLPEDARCRNQEDLLHKRIRRLAREAQNQGGLLTLGDLSFLLGVGLRSLQRHLKTMRNLGKNISHRGSILKVGPKTRKEEI